MFKHIFSRCFLSSPSSLSLFRLLVFLFFFPIFSQPIFLLHTIVPFRHPATLLARRWQVGLIIVQVFFKERITRSMFTASFSFSSCLLYLRHFFFLFVSLHCGCIFWCIRGVKKTVSERTELFTKWHFFCAFF